jgi:hypothetical protein
MDAQTAETLKKGQGRLKGQACLNDNKTLA